MAEYYAITGIPLPKTKDTNHPIPIRQEMNKWYQSPENDIQVSLFIQALDRFQQMSWDEKLSFFQVAGMYSVLIFGKMSRANICHNQRHSWFP